MNQREIKQSIIIRTEEEQKVEIKTRRRKIQKHYPEEISNRNNRNHRRNNNGQWMYKIAEDQSKGVPGKKDESGEPPTFRRRLLKEKSSFGTSPLKVLGGAL